MTNPAGGPAGKKCGHGDSLHLSDVIVVVQVWTTLVDFPVSSPWFPAAWRQAVFVMIVEEGRSGRRSKIRLTVRLAPAARVPTLYLQTDPATARQGHPRSS